MFSLLGRFLFVLPIFLFGVYQIKDQTQTTSILLNRYERFENLVHSYGYDNLAIISQDSLKQQADQITKITGLGLVVVSVGVVSYVPFVSFFLTIFFSLCIILIHNPLYYETRQLFFIELTNCAFDLAFIGISLAMIFGNTEKTKEIKKKNKKRKSKTSEKQNKQEKLEESVKKNNKKEKEKEKLDSKSNPTKNKKNKGH